MIAYAYPQWMFLPSSGPCFASGDELWYSANRFIGGGLTLAIAVLAIVGIIRGGAGRKVGTVTLILAAALLMALGFATYVLFHVSTAACP